VAVVIGVLVVLALVALLGAALSLRIVKQYEQGVLFRLGKVTAAGTLSEASRSCSSGRGTGIASGAVGWTTVTLPPGATSSSATCRTTMRTACTKNS
jgi:hypothetical protein